MQLDFNIPERPIWNAAAMVQTLDPNTQKESSGDHHIKQWRNSRVKTPFMEAWSDRMINKPPNVDAPSPVGKYNKNRRTPSFRTPGFDSLKTPDMQRTVNFPKLFRTMVIATGYDHPCPISNRCCGILLSFCGKWWCDFLMVIFPASLKLPGLLASMGSTISAS